MSVIVTGATGHLGPHLIAELLRTTAFDRVYVVARSSHEPAESRVRSIERVARTMLESRDDTGSGRVVPVEADLLATGSLYLCRDATVILHAAADTRFTAPDEVLRRANVHSTLAMCRFAETCPRLRQFLFVSTACVAGRRIGSVPERLLDDSAGFANAYEQTKWEAEQIVADTRLPARIARLTTCVGSHETGYVNRLGAVHHLLRWMSRGLVPMIPGTESTPVDLISTDVAAAWLARAATQPPDALEVCHIARGRDAIRLGELLDTLTKLLNSDGRRRVPRPLIVDHGAFSAFNEVVRLSGDALFARVQASAGAVLPSLLYPKVYETGQAEACWSGALPHGPWPELLRRVIAGSDLVSCTPVQETRSDPKVSSHV
jgi:long-chain acyl-CoA synthetase